LKEAIRLNPLEGHLWLGFAYMSMQKYEKALESVEHSLAIQPTVLAPHMFAAVSYAHIGREEEAKEAFKKYLPKLGGVYIRKIQGLYFDYPFKNPDTFNRFVEGLVKAGYEKDPEGYYEVNEAKKLKGQEIKELLIGKTTTGDNYIGYGQYWHWSEHWSEEGVLEYKKRVDGVTYIGEYWVEGDVLCQRFENRFEGVKHCFDVYYNPEGTITGKYQYLKLGDFSITPFSIEG
jgi:tetratricopeptide (TPR) repeat protein